MRSSAGLVRLAVSPGDLRRHELLVDAELADAGEHARERPQHAADVIGAVHVGRVEPGDHRIEARLRVRRQRSVGDRDRGVGERVVVERRIALQVVGRREIARVPVRPLLLQRDAEQRRAADPRPHDLQELADVDALLDVVRQVEVRVVEISAGGCRLRPRRRRLRRRRRGLRQHPDEQHPGRQGNPAAESRDRPHRSAPLLTRSLASSVSEEHRERRRQRRARPGRRRSSRTCC